MDASDIEEFDKFIEDNWGIKAKDNSSHEEEKVIVTKKEVENLKIINIQTKNRGEPQNGTK